MLLYKSYIHLLLIFIIAVEFNTARAQDWLKMHDSSNHYLVLHNHNKALEFSLNALEKYQISGEKKDTNLTNILRNVYTSYYYLGETGLAIGYAEKYKELNKIIFSEESYPYAESLNDLGLLYSLSGKTDKSEELYLQALKIYNEVIIGADPGIAQTLNNLAVLYENQGRHYDAEPLYEKALDMNRVMFENDHPDLANSINNMAFFYENRGTYYKAEPLYTEALEMRRRLFKGDHPDLATSINNLAGFLLVTGRYDEAGPLFEEALDMKRRLYPSDNTELALSINNLAGFYNDQGKPEKAEPLFIEALDMIKRLITGDHPYKALSMNNLAVFYKSLAMYDKAGPLFVEALDMRRRLSAGDHADLASQIHNMAVYFWEKGKNIEAHKYFLEALEMRKRIFNDNHPALSESYYTLGVYYDNTGMHRKAEKHYIKAVRIDRKMIKDFFPALSEDEKAKYLATFKENLDMFNSFAIRRSKENPDILKTVLENQIVLKGILLSYSIKIKKSLFRSGELGMMKGYNEWTSLRNELASYYMLSNDQLSALGINIDSLVNAINKLEKKLTGLPFFKTTIVRKEYKYEDIRTNLEESEALIEIVRIKYHEKNTVDSVVYTALLVTKDTKEPALVVMNNGKELETIYSSYYKKSIKFKIEDTESYNNYWGQIASNQLLKSKNKIYFSPDGIYYQISLESLKNPASNDYLIDENNIQILSNAKDIAINSATQEKKKSAVLIGDPIFGRNPKDTNLKSERNSIKRLPGTGKEVKNIGKMLREHQFSVETFTATDANESIIKSINNPSVLHIATHGIYLPSKSKPEKIPVDTKNTFNSPLFRSMMLLAGSETALFRKGRNIQAATEDKVLNEDGLLTAYEVQGLNLDRTELVVMSACESGLGDVKYGEGVYGLQRAFRHAGAKTIIMSLWKVSDRATLRLMELFYKYWLSGESIRLAFKKARLELRKEFPHPYYWGAFVVVGN